MREQEKTNGEQPPRVDGEETASGNGGEGAYARGNLRIPPALRNGTGAAQEAVLIRRAVRQGWGLTNEERRRVVDQMLADLGSSPSVRDRAACARVLVAADHADVRREAIEQAALGQTSSTHVALMREALRTPEGRAALAALTGSMAVQASAPAIPGSTVPPVPQPPTQ